MTDSAFTAAMRALAPPPCGGPEQARCPFYQRCRDARMACQAFSRYVNAGRAVRKPWEAPSRGMYERIFKHQQDDVEGEVW